MIFRKFSLMKCLEADFSFLYMYMLVRLWIFGRELKVNKVFIYNIFGEIY